METRALRESPAGEVPAAPAWRVTGAAVQGVSHARLNLPCQDAQAWRILDDGMLLVALSDGAGSAAYSDQGAALAVSAALDAMTDLLSCSQPALETTTTQSDAAPGAAEEPPGEQNSEDLADPGVPTWEDVMLEVLSRARERVLQAADGAGEWSREYAATLTCVIAAGDGLVVAQIGDGAVVAVDENGELFSAVRLQRGEYANETHFLTQDDALEQAVIEVYERPVGALAVMSDGLIRLALKMPSQEPHAPFFEPLFRFARAGLDGEQAVSQLAAFLNSERVNARTDDDKSLVLAVRTGAASPQEGA